ncbi:hypothetical protein [Lactococcus hircilactis]|uniref:hypothetical protein n=1 Tax=Lactococcus hircilactis TaxID=1494462 RepID=UPI003FA24DF2
MKFRFYSAAFITPDGKTKCNSSEIEFASLEEAADFMRIGVIRQDDLGMAFIPLVCEAIEEEDK